MPNGIYPVPPSLQVRKDASSEQRASRPGLAVRIKTWLERDHLDKKLAEGIDAETSPELTLRAQRLGSDAGRTRLARDLEATLQGARRPATMSHLLLRRRRVQSCADELLQLAGRLRDDQPISVRGAAMTAVLLSDGKGPLYYEHATVPLRQSLRSARSALDEVDQAGQPAFSAAA